MEKTDNEKISPNLEMYLETVLLLFKERGTVRITDIAANMNVAKSSVHTAMHALSDKGLLSQEKYGGVLLTEKGKEYAAGVYARHKGLTAFFERVVGVDAQTAAQDACAVEHVISDKSMRNILKMIKETANKSPEC